MNGNLEYSLKKAAQIIALILWGDEILAYVPSCLGGEDHGINVT